MVSAVSSASRPATTTARRWHFAQVPDLNRETKHKITKASAWPTFMGICLALRQEERKGRTASIRQAAKDEQKISVGLRHLARDMGLNVSTVRRQVRRLVDIGVIAVWRPNVEFRADLATGQIRTKAKGRCENTRVYLTILPEHLRPAKPRREMGADCAHQQVESSLCKVQSAPTVRDSKNQRTPDGDAGGIGTPPAVPAGRLTAATAGGHSAAKAGQDGMPVMPADAGRDEPELPAGRLSRAAAKVSPPRRTAYNDGVQRRTAEEASAAFCKPDPAMDRMRAEYLAAKAAKASRNGNAANPVGMTATEAIEQDRAADDLRKALDDLPDDSRQRARDHGRTIEGDETRALQRIIEEKRRQVVDELRVDAEAKAARKRQMAAG